MELTDVSIDATVALAKPKKTKKMAFSTKDLVFLFSCFLRQEKGHDN